MNVQMDPALATLARQAGIWTDWQDAAGRAQQVDESVLRRLLDCLDLPCRTTTQMRDSMQMLEQDRDLAGGDVVVVQAGRTPRLRCRAQGRWTLTLESGRIMTGSLRRDGLKRVSIDPVSEPGYHTLELAALAVTLAVVPSCCPVLVVKRGEPRMWGAVAQIYSLPDSSASRNDAYSLPVWTQGRNFTAVGRLAQCAARAGADALALSPAHAMFSADPGRYSPYSPSSRQFLNVCYGDPVQVLGADVVHRALASWNHHDLSALRNSASLLDWPRLATLRLRLLRDVFDQVHDRLPRLMARRFATFRQTGASALQRHAVYEALHAAQCLRLGVDHGWHDWDAPLHDPGGPAVAQFARDHPRELEFHMFAQWLVFENARHAQDCAKSAGMACGLIRDLAIGTDPRGSDAWSRQHDILTGVSVGAPPDVYQRQGQNWGLTALSPRSLRRGAYGMFIATLRACMQDAGGIRIDHVAGMERLWLIPDGSSAAEGAYLSYPQSDMLGLIALEASRHDTIVIGENLGTVSDELNRALAGQGMLGTNVLWFERDKTIGDTESAPFRSARRWTAQAVSMPSTHDLPTVHGWWQERDIGWKVLLDALDPATRDLEQARRGQDRAALWRVLQQDGYVVASDGTPPVDTPLDAILAFVARTPAALALFSLEDLLGLLDQPNMPGGDVGNGPARHPNWIQQLPVPVDAVFSDDAVLARISGVRRARSRP